MEGKLAVLDSVTNCKTYLYFYLSTKSNFQRKTLLNEIYHFYKF